MQIRSVTMQFQPNGNKLWLHFIFKQMLLDDCFLPA